MFLKNKNIIFKIRRSKVTEYAALSIFIVFLKNRNFISKIRRSKVTDYAALKQTPHS